MRKIAIVMLLFIVLLMVAAPVFAQSTSGSIRDQLQSEFDEEGVISTLDQRAYSLIQQARVIAGIIAVAFLVAFGYSMFTAGGDPNKYAAAKAKLIGFVAALFFIFSAEALVGGLLRLMGADL